MRQSKMLTGLLLDNLYATLGLEMSLIGMISCRHIEMSCNNLQCGRSIMCSCGHTTHAC